MVRRFSPGARRAGSFLWRNRVGVLKAATTIARFKPVIDYSSTAAARYDVTDLTALWEADLGRQTLSPTVIAVRGLIGLRRTSAPGQVVEDIMWGYGLYVGVDTMDSDDFPYIGASPARFMGSGVKNIPILPPMDLTVTELDTGSHNLGLPIPHNTGQFAIRSRVSQRLLPGQHLYLITRAQGVGSFNSSDTQVASLRITGEVQVSLRIRG